MLFALAVGCGFTDKDRTPPPDGVSVDGSGNTGSRDAGPDEGGGGGWQCDPSWYEDAEFCDCGCGLADPDCGTDGCAAIDCCTPASCASMGCVFCGPSQSTCL